MFDRQTNTPRGWYLARLLEATSRPGEYRRLIVESFPSIRSRSNRNQVVGILYHLARGGDIEAANFIRRNWLPLLRRNRSGDGHEYECARRYMQLDGFEAYREVVSWAVAAAHRTRTSDAFWWLHLEAEEGRWKHRARKLRESLALKTPELARRMSFPEFEVERQGARKPQRSLEESIRNGRLYRFSTDQEKGLAIKMIGEELGVVAKRRLLLALAWAGVPLALSDVEPLFDHADARLRRAAYNTLKNTCDPRVRELAFKLIEDEAFRDTGIGLLESNYRPGDESLVYELILKERYGVVLHGLVRAAINLMETLTEGEWTRVLRACYERSPCDLCRNTAVRKMIPRRLLSVEDFQELAFDSDDHTRKLARACLRRRSRTAQSAL